MAITLATNVIFNEDTGDTLVRLAINDTVLLLDDTIASKIGNMLINTVAEAHSERRLIRYLRAAGFTSEQVQQILTAKSEEHPITLPVAASSA